MALEFYSIEKTKSIITFRISNDFNSLSFDVYDALITSMSLSTYVHVTHTKENKTFVGHSLELVFGCKSERNILFYT